MATMVGHCLLQPVLAAPANGGDLRPLCEAPSSSSASSATRLGGRRSRSRGSWKTALKAAPAVGRSDFVSGSSRLVEAVPAPKGGRQARKGATCVLDTETRPVTVEEEKPFRAWEGDGLNPAGKRTDLKKIMIFGAGPIVIGQACEFDYSGTQVRGYLRTAREACT